MHGRALSSRRRFAAAALALSLLAPVAGAWASEGPPSVSQSPPQGPDGPPAPLGRRPTGTDRTGRTPLSAVASMRGPATLRVRAAPLVRGVSDGALLRRTRGAERASLLRQVRRDGASIVRIPAEWRLNAPRQLVTPRDPGDPGYRFQVLDGMVRAVAAAHLKPFIVVSHAPAWAEAAPRWDFAAPGSWGVRPEALAAFATALARRYSGRYVPPGAPRALPSVRLFQAWNEPNLPAYLGPQWIAPAGRWQPWAPRQYRRMLNAVYSAVKRVRRDASVISGGLAPNGEAVDGEGRMPPLRFLRAFLCLDPNGRPMRPRCPDPPRMDGFGFHPLSTGDPDLPAVSHLDIAVADISKATRALDTAVAAGILRSRPPVWVTEINWTTPQAASGAATAPQWVGRAFQRLWRAGTRVVTWQFVQDRPGERSAGLRGRDGRPKAVLRAFRFPLDVVRENARVVRVWTLGPSGSDRRICVSLLHRGRWIRVRCATATAGRPLVMRVRVRGRAWLRAGTRRAHSARIPVGR